MKKGQHSHTSKQKQRERHQQAANGTKEGCSHAGERQSKEEVSRWKTGQTRGGTHTLVIRQREQKGGQKAANWMNKKQNSHARKQRQKRREVS